MVSVVDKVTFSDPVKGVPVADRAYVFYNDGSGCCAATEHNVRQGQLGPGRAISLRSIGERFNRITGHDVLCVLPPEVFISNQHLFAWHTASRYAPMWFSVGGRQFAVRVQWPPLVWIVNRRDRGLRIFALGRSSRPAMDTIVYHAPLMNIGSNGRLCEGSAKLPRQLDERHLHEIEACVFESNFTHVNHDKTLKGAKDNKAHVAFWRNKERLKEAVKVKELVRAGTLGEHFW